MALIPNLYNETLASLSFKDLAERLRQDLSDVEIMETELMRQVKYNELKADLWKIAADERNSGVDLINHLLELTGRMVDVSKVTYNELQASEDSFRQIVQWVKPGLSATQSILISALFAGDYFQQEKIAIPSDLEPEHKTQIRLNMEQTGDRSILIVPFRDEIGEPNRFVSFCEHESTREWDEFDVSILQELVQIISQQIREYRKNLALETNIKKYQAYVEQSNNIIYTISPDGIVTYVSPTWTEELGYYPEEVIGQPFTLFLHQDDISGSWETLTSILNSGLKQTQGTFRIKRKDGLWRWYATNSTVFRDEYDKSISLLGVAHDITERIENEQLLIRERKRFFGLIENIPTVVMEISDAGIINFVNQRVETEAGFAAGDLVGKHYLEAGLIVPEYHKELVNAFEELQTGGEVQGLEIVMLSKDEEEMFFEINAIPLENRILAAITNITEIKLASQKLKKAYDELEVRIQDRTRQLQDKNLELNQEITERKKIEEELRDSRQKLHLVFDTIPHSIFWKDRQSVYQGCNRNFADIAGLRSPEGVIGKTDLDLPWTKEQAESFIQLDQQVMDNNKSESHIIEQLLKADGSTAWTNTTKTPLLNTEGNVIGMLGTLEDITEELEIRKQEKVREQQLVKADKMISLGILVAGVAHEINNPNQFIMSHISPLKRVCDEVMPILEKYSTEYGDFRLAGMNYSQMKQRLPTIFANLMSGSQRIKNIVEELREYIREYPSEHIESIQFNSVVESALTLLENLIKKSTTVFRVDYGKDLPFIKGHYQQLEQVIINLVQNACQALTSNDEGIFISTSYDKTENTILFTVEDEGTGIPEEQLDRVTDLFFTTKRDIGGIGLGLAISSKIILEHEGKMTFSSGKKKGTQATIALPLERQESGKAELPKLSAKLFT